MKKNPKESGPAPYWTVVFVYAAIMFFVSSRTLPAIPYYYRFHLDKVAHFFEFALFAVLLCRAIRRTAGLSVARVMGVAILIAAGYAVSDEIHQKFVPGRVADWKDMTSDIVGALAGAFVWRSSTAMQRQRPNRPGETLDSH